MNPTIDAVLVYPNPSLDSPVKGTALSIFYVGAAAEAAGMKIEYVDERFDGTAKVNELLQQNPLVLAISSMTGFQLQETLRILKYTKEHYPHVKTVLGGVHASLLPEECIASDLVDFIVIGEGEATFSDLLFRIKTGQSYEKIEGVWWKKGGQIIRNKERAFLDPKDWPFPMTEKNKVYFRKSAAAGELFYLSSRGCPYRCRFCYNNVFNKKKWRLMPTDKLKKELKLLHDEFKFDYLFLNDDNIGSLPKRLAEISMFLHSLGVRWGACIRANDVTEENIKVMSENGCDRFLMGVETGSEKLLRQVIGKDLPNGLQDIRNAVQIISKTPIHPTYSFMSNIPTETYQDLVSSMELADWIHRTDPKARLGFYVYAPYPGTALFEEAKHQGMKMPETIEEWGQMSLSNDRNVVAENLYYISGLNFRGDVSQKKFPGLYRLQIFFFEVLAKIRWKWRFLTFFDFEKKIVKHLFKVALMRLNAQRSDNHSSSCDIRLADQ